MLALLPDRGLGTVAGDDPGCIGQEVELFPDRHHQILERATREIGAPNGVGEQGVPRE
jgi:hypothetical protein